MISGPAKAVLALLFLLIALPAAAAEAAWELDALGAALAADADGNDRVAFREERHVAYLSAPVELSGVLVRRDGRLEKHVTAPAPESFILDGTSAEVRTADGETITFALVDHPLLKALASALRTALAGDVDRLQREFDVSLEGDRASWRLRIFPREDAQRDVLDEITISGRQGHVGSIRIAEIGGDSSIMMLAPEQP